MCVENRWKVTGIANDCYVGEAVQYIKLLV